MAGRKKPDGQGRRMNRVYGEFFPTGGVLDVETRQLFPSVDAWHNFRGNRDGYLIIHFPGDADGKEASETLLRALTAKKG